MAAHLQSENKNYTKNTKNKERVPDKTWTDDKILVFVKRRVTICEIAADATKGMQARQADGFLLHTLRLAKSAMVASGVLVDRLNDVLKSIDNQRLVVHDSLGYRNDEVCNKSEIELRKLADMLKSFRTAYEKAAWAAVESRKAVDRASTVFGQVDREYKENVRDHALDQDIPEAWESIGQMQTSIVFMMDSMENLLRSSLELYKVYFDVLEEFLQTHKETNHQTEKENCAIVENSKDDPIQHVQRLWHQVCSMWKK